MISLGSKSENSLASTLAITWRCKAWFVCDLVGNPENSFYHNKCSAVFSQHLLFTGNMNSVQI